MYQEVQTPPDFGPSTSHLGEGNLYGYTVYNDETKLYSLFINGFEIFKGTKTFIESVSSQYNIIPVF